MKPFVPERLYIEKGCEGYALGRQLIEKYAHLESVWIDDHNRIPELRERPDSDFPKLKRCLVLGIRKSLAHQRNNKTSDFLVPYTSSGCSAMCLYCYLVCTYFTSAYLRVFVNREAMMTKLRKAAAQHPGSVFEIGSNSDLVLENSVSGSLEWTVAQFADVREARLTLPTKFDMVEPLLTLAHGGNVTVRMSLNPAEVIRRVEFGTSGLRERIAALNRLCRAGYGTGLLVAPVILLPGWQDMYERLFVTMADELAPELLRDAPVEIIFMTYGVSTRNINAQAFPNAVPLYDAAAMAFCGRGRYGYTPDVKRRAAEWLRERIARHLPEARIAYIV